MHRSRGLTLMELMVTLVVLGVLIGVVIPGFQNFYEQSRSREAISLLDSVWMAQKLHYVHNNRYWPLVAENPNPPAGLMENLMTVNDRVVINAGTAGNPVLNQGLSLDLDPDVALTPSNVFYRLSVRGGIHRAGLVAGANFVPYYRVVAIRGSNSNPYAGPVRRYCWDQEGPPRDYPAEFPSGDATTCPDNPA